MSVAIVAVGSNIPDRLKNIVAAIELLAPLGKISAMSAIYETPPVGYENQAHFLNGALALETKIPPYGLLQKMQKIELSLGRVREIKNGPRTVDLDLIFCDGDKINSQELTLPHPRWSERDFVITPLLDLLDKGMFVGNHFENTRAFLAAQNRKFKQFAQL